MKSTQQKYLQTFPFWYYFLYLKPDKNMTPQASFLIITHKQTTMIIYCFKVYNEWYR